LKRVLVRCRPRLVNAAGRSARFADVGSLDVGVVIWARGYGPDYSWISMPGVVANGRAVHQREVTDVPRLYDVVGCIRVATGLERSGTSPPVTNL
jgi:putative flavoprotein involved in K+ transport